MTGKRIIYFIVTFLIGAQFIFSGYSKLDSIQMYEIELVNYGLADWFWAKYLGRLVISFEFMLGLLLLIQYKPDRKILWISTGTMVFFSLFVVYHMLWGDMQSCGCFGELIELTPEQTLLKNAFSLGLLILGFITYTPGTWITGFWRLVTPVIIGVISVTTVIIIHPPFDVSGKHTPEVIGVGDIFPEVEAGTNDIGQTTGIAPDWYEGKKLVVFVSPGCIYCQQVATKMNVAYDTDQHRDRVLFAFLDARQNHLNEFFRKTGGKKFEYTRIDRATFLEVTKGTFPQIFYLDNGVVVRNIGKKELFENTPDF